MSKEFSITGNKAILNLSEQFFNDVNELLNSESFLDLTKCFINYHKKDSTRVYAYIEQFFINSSVDSLARELTDILKLLTVMNIDEVSSKINKYHNLNKEKDGLLKIVEEFYNYWRNLERYSIIQQNENSRGVGVVNFVEINEKLKNMILQAYRRIEMSILGEWPKVYRQVPAAADASIMIRQFNKNYPEIYKDLNKIPFITQVMIETPYITYTKSNKRDGFFEEVYENPILNTNINYPHFFCYPAKVGDNLIFIYFHRDLLTHGVSASNLFELADVKEIEEKTPDAIYIYGPKDEGERKNSFYYDKENKLYVGYIAYSDKIDYFGYLKKMVLTLNNVINIKKEYLPIHGAGLSVVLQNNKTVNIVILGDSGAGKSESIEAFRSLAKDYIKEMTIVFDDMGSFRIKNNKVYAYGTEIGAFVRLDDLDAGYAFKQIDRSIFMNPDKVNSRLIMPVASFDEINLGYEVDFFLYADNYSAVLDGCDSIEIFDKKEEALRVFKRGARLAKGTTTETGLVQTYFANPFGPVQKREECDKLLDKYFDNLFENKVKVGTIKTQLGLNNMQFEGPRSAAIELFELIKNM
ncbi:phosphoenolpyruvate carboxykinase [Anaerococcus sp. HMSC075B03]|uniref:phosphoenolpyruvate carboxykinase n=1 Tax=Anaerococcus TaxID=165779 RepID=UPI0008A1BD48|nr:MULTISPECIES: phosphoenolpyruvate carboxykinase [Anaerococcus]MBS4889851.1 phosphoenolpyruvate carboxykinase [Anaerococcus vaginalis]MDU5560496.1 phosphoenolpyruvate carboxykinase [Anaerococcus vaginalis]OFJ70674.1 phosphoenolpyruvate carboxykinase [Anaerococcus sp. HMSC065G05]OFO40241.1 phosphoenolpyruvate carboxykinase [Anaerococcus sp. HMSC075B03]